MTSPKFSPRRRRVRSLRTDIPCSSPYCHTVVTRSDTQSPHIDLVWMAQDTHGATPRRYDVTVCNWRCFFDWLASDDAHQQGVPDLELLLAIKQYANEARVDESLLERL